MALARLQKRLGGKYRICNIDWERCLYRDFKNGFSVEISDVHTTDRSQHATLHMWVNIGHPGESYVIKTVSDVPRCRIGQEVDKLYEYSKQLVRAGKTDRSCFVNTPLEVERYGRRA